MLRFDFSWDEETSGVVDPVLARTWAGLEITVDDDTSGSKCLTRLVSVKSGILRDCVYGSLFPLAQWLVENWWFLLSEPLRVPRVESGRKLAQKSAQRAWVRRHNFLNAREGGALPDLTLFRDGEEIAIVSAPDPERRAGNSPVRFLSEGTYRLERGAVRKALWDFVQAVVDRLEGLEDDDSHRLQENWRALVASEAREADLCSWSATLGVDPYDLDVPEEFMSLLQSKLSVFDEQLRRDLLEAAKAESFARSVDWLDNALSRVDQSASRSERVIGLASSKNGFEAHEAGYDVAAWLRERLRIPLDPIDNMQDVLQKCGWSHEFAAELPASPDGSLLLLLGLDQEGSPRVVGPVDVAATTSSERFKLGRALYLSLSDGRAPRLVTSAHSWDQRASRAFAAELLAPAAALRRRVDEATSEDELESLAKEFKVSNWVIGYQLRNHGISWAEGL